MLSMVKMLLKGKVGGHVLNSHGNYIENHGIVFLNFCENPGRSHLFLTPEIRLKLHHFPLSAYKYILLLMKPF